jgi:hypothetical protein
MNTQAEIPRLKSEYAEARSIQIRILEGSAQDPYRYGWALLNVAEMDVLIGAPKDEVQKNCDRARKMLDAAGDVEGVALCDVNLADLHLREGNSLAAKTILARCLKVTLEYSQMQTHRLERLGDISCWARLDGMSSWTTKSTGSNQNMLRLAVSIVAFLKQPLYRIPATIVLLYLMLLKLMCLLVLQRMMCRGIVTQPEEY